MTDLADTRGHVEHVMGTAFSFVLHPGPADTDDVRHAVASACAWLHHVDDVFSTWKPDSAISRLRRGELRLEDCPGDVRVVLALCRRARTASVGWFDPWAMPGGVDPSGLVKGWAAREALAFLKVAGVRAAMVNGGGDVATFGHPAPDRQWVVGIRDPADPTRCVCAVASPGAVATSGTYERGAHVLSPRNGAAADTVASATVLGPDLAMADALATGMLAAGGDGLALVDRLPGYSALVIDREGVLHHTAGVPFVVETAFSPV